MRYRIAKHKRGFVCVIYDGPNRRRVGLKATDRFAATAEAAELVGHIEQRKPRQRLTVGQIVEAYLEQSEAIWKDTEQFHWRGIRGRLGPLSPDDISEALLKEMAAKASVSVGSIRKRYSVVRAALRWAARKGHISKAPHIWLPPAPPPKGRRLSREEADALRGGSVMPHVRLFIEVGLGTGARAGAILSLRWEMVSDRSIRFSTGLRQKSRATVVPVNDTLREALERAREGAMTDYVIEWAGKPVKSIKRGFREAVKRAGLGSEVTPHVLRHTAASWMAEAGGSNPLSPTKFSAIYWRSEAAP